MIAAGEGGGNGTVLSPSLGLTGAAATAAAAAGGRVFSAVGGGNGGTNKESVASASKRTQHYLRALQVSTALGLLE